MDEKIDSVRMVLSRLFDHLASDDRAFLGGFNDDFHLVQSLTDDRSALDAAIARLEPFGDTALYDAVVEGLERLNRSNGRRALILISDGLDNCSQSTARRAVDIAKTAGIRIYAVGIGERTRHRNLYSVLFPRARRAPSRGIDENRLRELAESTGGRLISVSDTKARPDSDESLRSAFGRLSRELRMMYVLAYRPARQEFDGRWRHIRVEITRPNLVVRFREGYFAVRPAH